MTKPPGGMWNRDSQSLTWPVGGAEALIVGDLGLAQLADLAMQVIVGVDGWPRLSVPWLLDSFAPELVTTFRSPAMHHVRYPTGDLRQESKLGNGQVWTGVSTGAFLESKVFVERANPAGLVRGHQAIYSSSLYPQWLALGPDSGTLAWESAPGEVTFIGFSGTANRAVAIEVLRELANKGSVLTLAQWESRDRAQVDSKPDPLPLDVPGLGPG
ncbi:MAG: hypothetical protein ABI782_09805 [Anaerolineaceae bacterium]